MARRSLRPELNRIRGWVRQGRTDAWIAHQLEVTVQQIQAFKREQGLEPDADPETHRRRGRLRRRDRPQSRGRRVDRGRTGSGRGPARGGSAEEEDEDERTARRRRPSAGAAAAVVVAAPGARPGTDRSDLRPRRRGLRPVARPRRTGRPDLRRVLGRSPSRSRSRSKKIRSSSAASARTTRTTATPSSSYLVFWGGLSSVRIVRSERPRVALEVARAVLARAVRLVD